jgi:hypothetical protein
VTTGNDGRDTTVERIEAAFDDVVAYMAAADEGENSSPDEPVKRYQATRERILASPEVAVPFLADQFDADGFVRKESAYDLLVRLAEDPDVRETIEGLIDGKEPLPQLWLISVLHFHGDSEFASRFEELLSHSDPYVRHLAALATVFQGFVARTDSDELMDALVSALSSDRSIEGSIFYVADSALSCITLVTGERFTDTQEMPVDFYNFDHLVSEPPVHPFPYTTDRVVDLTESKRRSLVTRVGEWWEANRGTATLTPTTGAFER